MPARRRARSVAATAAILTTAALGASAAATLAAATEPVAVGVQLTGRTALAQVVSSTVLIDRGTISGSPVGSGRITLVYTLRPDTGVAITRFKVINARGTVAGRAVSSYVATGLHITFTGVGTLTGGTGAYAGIRGRPLRFGATHSITGRKEAVTLTGRATLP